MRHLQNGAVYIKFKFKKKHLKICEKKFYEFKSNDFCLNGNNCNEIREEKMKAFGLFVFRNLTTTRKIQCQCPAEQSFRCGKYHCTADSIARDYLKSNGKQMAKILKNCHNHNITTYKTPFNIISRF